MSHKQHHYNTTVRWTGNLGTGTSGYRDYGRNHDIEIPEKQTILGSSDPAFRGDKTRHNPEDLLLSSISACHMLWYLHLCSEAGIVVLEYEDRAEAIMEETEDGGGRFVKAILHPKTKLADLSRAEEAMHLHEEANRLCFIANSLNFKVEHMAECV